MVARPSTDQSAQTRVSRTNSTLDELSRQVSGGAVGLKDGDGNTVQLLGGSHPMFGSRKNDVAVMFNADGSVSVTTASGAAAPLTTGDHTVTGDQVVSGDAVVSGNHNVAGDTYAGGQAYSATVLASGDVSGGSVSSYGDTNTYGTTYAEDVYATDVYASGDIIGSGYVGQSDARLKEAFQPVDDDLLDRLLAAPVQRWRWKTRWEWDVRREEWRDRTPNDREHIHPVAQDMPPELVVETPSGYLAVDALSSAGALLALVQRQQGQIDELRARIEALEPQRPTS